MSVVLFSLSILLLFSYYLSLPFYYYLLFPLLLFFLRCFQHGSFTIIFPFHTNFVMLYLNRGSFRNNLSTRTRQRLGCVHTTSPDPHLWDYIGFVVVVVKGKHLAPKCMYRICKGTFRLCREWTPCSLFSSTKIWFPLFLLSVLFFFWLSFSFSGEKHKLLNSKQARNFTQN